MAAGRRSRAGAPTVTTHPDPTRSEQEKEPKPKAKSEPEDSPIAPPKTSLILKVSLIFLIPYFLLIFFHYDIDFELKKSISINALLSLAGFFVTVRLIPVLSSKVMRKNIFGFDINKKGTSLGSVKVPESMGIVVGIVFLVVVILFQFFSFFEDSKWLLEYNNAALTSILFMFLLGFMDDVLDLPWRVKLLLPSIAALPLLMAYVGHTTIIIPKPLVPYVGIPMLDLGGLYKIYMLLLAVFCTNSINIHAGINGLEVGQTVVISCAILMHNVMLIGVPINPEYKQAYAFSIYLVQPFLATSLALLSYNWYPSSVFVGDTYTYFAGMTLAVVGILGHFSETLLLFFIPQILNFLLSVPQLAGIRFCPRHRLPKFDPQTGLLTGTDDGTVVNLYLRLFGRRSEQSLCIHLLVFQAICCCLSFVLRWIVAGWYK